MPPRHPLDLLTALEGDNPQRLPGRTGLPALAEAVEATQDAQAEPPTEPEAPQGSAVT
jgi:hypothetical protein